jgi:GH15 family glucan-1,4-alpha-glucosidase
MTSPTEYLPLSEYGMISDAHSAALVSRRGSIDWMCLPRFDSPAIFARLLDARAGGHWQIEVPNATSVTRRYLPGTNVLETTFEAPGGVASLTDAMPVHPHATPEAPSELVVRERVVRVLRALHGTVAWRMVCRPRFDYGTFVPQLALLTPHLGHAHGGAQGLTLSAGARLTLVDDEFQAGGTLQAGDTFHAVLRYDPRYQPGARTVPVVQATRLIDAARRHWEDWSAHGVYAGPDRAHVLRSALVLKGLTYEPSGAFVAAPTTSLPERVGGGLNWDYRFTWLRDASFVLQALFRLGYGEEAQAFLQWLDWAAAGRARDLQLVYGLGGERRLIESEIPELEGWRGSRPVRVGNAAHAQFQLDVYGELLDAVHEGYRFAGTLQPERWSFLARVAQLVAQRWREPDEGIWETREGRKHHVHSKVMAWTALDRSVRLARACNLPGDLERWAAERELVRAEILERGFHAGRGAFTQAYGSEVLDAAVLQIPLLGFLPADDPRMASTIEVLRRELSSSEGFVWRNEMHGAKGSEGTFVACTFWMVENLVLAGRLQEAQELFDRTSACANDLGLFAEEIEAGTGQPLGNFPQAFSHLGHIQAAVRLAAARGAAPHGGPEAAPTGGARSD